MPDRSDGYQVPSWPKTLIDRLLWNNTMADLDARLKAREELEASFESLKAQGIQASLDYIQVNVAPQIANLQQSITLAQDQIDQIIIGGKAPDTLKFGGELPAYYATAQALAEGLAGKVANTRKVNNKELSADISLGKGDVGLGNVDNTADADKPISTDQAVALAKRVRVDAVQNLSEAEKGQARANVGGGVLSSFRNKLINGDFIVWQRGSSQTSSGYGSDDRWANLHIGSTKTHSFQPFPVGQTDVPGDPVYFSRTVVTSVTGAGNTVIKQQKVEDVRTLAGNTCTVTFYAKANAPRKIALDMEQNFGSGGALSAAVTGIGSRKFDLTTSWQKFSHLVQVPSIATKTLGSNGNSHLILNFWFDAGTNWNARTQNLGHQSGTFDIAHVSLVEGDATAEADPFSPRHFQQEIALCQRYFEQVPGTNHSSKVIYTHNHYKVVKRATPSFVMVTGNLGGSDIDVGNSSGHSFRCPAGTVGGALTDWIVGADAEL
jgi:hypothetical protein